MPHATPIHQTHRAPATGTVPWSRHASARLRRWLAVLTCTVGLAGCASAPPTPFHTPDLTLPRQVQALAADRSHPDPVTVSVTQQGQALIWTARDPRGHLLSQEQLQYGQWNALPSSPAAPRYTRLFAVLLLAWTPVKDLEFSYGPDAVHLGRLPNGDPRRTLADCDGIAMLQVTTLAQRPGWERLDIGDTGESWLIGPVDVSPPPA